MASGEAWSSLQPQLVVAIDADSGRAPREGQEEEKEGGQRRRGELTGGGQKVMMVTWMPPVHHITGMSERLWQVAQALVGLGLQVGCRVVDMQAYTPGGSCACTLSLSTLNRHAELAAHLRHMGARTEYCARHACD